MITPRTDKILIELGEEGIVEGSHGLYIPTKGQSRDFMRKQSKYKIEIGKYDLHIRTGEVKAVGEKVRDVAVGDTITFNIHNGEEFKHEGKRLFLLEEKYAIAKIAVDNS